MSKTVIIPTLKFKSNKKFGILKHLGFKFQKLYAANYMQWCKKQTGSSRCVIRVWAKGRDVEIANKGVYSGIIALYIKDMNIDCIKKGLFSNFYKITINTNTNKIEQYDSNIHNTSKVYTDAKKYGWSDDIIEEKLCVIEETYETFIFKQDFVDMVNEMWNDGYVEIINEEYKEW